VLRRSASVSIRQHPSASVSICQHTSAYVSIRQHTSAYVRRLGCFLATPGLLSGLASFLRWSVHEPKTLMRSKSSFPAKELPQNSGFLAQRNNGRLAEETNTHLHCFHASLPVFGCSRSLIFRPCSLQSVNGVVCMFGVVSIFFLFKVLISTSTPPPPLEFI
jgi:hypothetical protein